MRELRELVLPQLVEARKRASLDIDSNSQRTPSLHHSQSSSTSSDPMSPATPTISLRGHFRFPSIVSSPASSPSMRESMDGYVAKRPLTDVREEPHERDGDVQDVEFGDAPVRESFDEDIVPQGRPPLVIHTDRDLDFDADYSWVDSPTEMDDFNDFDLYASKRQRADDSVSTRFGGHIQSLSRKWKSKMDKRISSIEDSFHESIASRSRTNSLKTASISEARAADGADRRDNPQMLPTPALSFVEDGADAELNNNNHHHLADMEEEDDEEGRADDDDDDDEDGREGLVRTPLLPPVMPTLQREEEPVRSPLQSPKVAESPCMGQNPFDNSPVVHHHGLPSPPLSTRPSVSSFHHRPVIPSSEIPPIILADPNDEWARKLGHANFTIQPEPYLPALPASIAACNQLRDDWDAARRNFLKHLARTAEHYSKTSKVHQMTEEKWIGVDATWKRYHDQALASVTAFVATSVSTPSTTFPAVVGGGGRSRSSSTAVGHQPPPQQHRRPSIEDATAHDLSVSIQSLKQQPTPLHMRMPSINSPQREGKFPKIGDVGIVGPMEQIRPVNNSPLRSRKRAFWKFLQGVLPSSVAFGRSNSA